VHQRSVQAVGALLLVASLALSGCGTKSDSTTTAAQGKQCDLKIGMFGALTGPNASLGIYIQNGAKLAIEQYNTKNSACKVTLATFDSQGDPTQAPGLAKKAIDDKKIVGIVGPAFSGESKAADPAFNEAGLVTITPSATNPALADNGWKTFFRNIGNDATQGPAAAKYIRDTIKSTKTFVIDDASEYGKGLADIVRKDLGKLVVGNDGIQAKQTDFGPSVTAVKASGADAVFFGGYSPEAAPLVKQLRAAGWKARMSRMTAPRLRTSSPMASPLPRAPSSPAHAPLRRPHRTLPPPTRRPTTSPPAPTPVKVSTPRRSCSTASPRARTARAWSTSSSPTTRRA